MNNQIMTINGRVNRSAAPVSERCMAVSAMFGLGVDRNSERILFDDLRLILAAGEVVLITGPSGAGKSTILRGIEAHLSRQSDCRCVRLEHIPAPADRAIVDCFAGPLEEGLSHLARAGLSEAPLLLQSPAELSEGQRFRYRLAKFFASDVDILIADEFGATLDRVTARVVAFQLGKFVRASMNSPRPRAAVVATTHEDLGEDLGATIRIHIDLDGQVEIAQGEPGVTER